MTRKSIGWNVVYTPSKSKKYTTSSRADHFSRVTPLHHLWILEQNLWNEHTVQGIFNGVGLRVGIDIKLLITDSRSPCQSKRVDFFFWRATWTKDLQAARKIWLIEEQPPFIGKVAARGIKALLESYLNSWQNAGFWHFETNGSSKRRRPPLAWWSGYVLYWARCFSPQTLPQHCATWF